MEAIIYIILGLSVLTFLALWLLAEREVRLRHDYAEALQDYEKAVKELESLQKEQEKS